MAKVVNPFGGDCIPLENPLRYNLTKVVIELREKDMTAFTPGKIEIIKEFKK